MGKEPGMVAYAFNPCTWEAEAVESLLHIANSRPAYLKGGGVRCDKAGSLLSKNR